MNELLDYPNIEGKISLSSYLKSKTGQNPGFLERTFNAISGFLPTDQKNELAKDRIRCILDMAYATETGRKLIESGAKNRISIAFNTGFPDGYGNFKNNIVSVSPKDPDDYLANIIVHELQHARQHNSIRSALGNSRYFYIHAKGLADTAYPMIVQEADAYAIQAIQAYEMHLQGIKGPWAIQKFSFKSSPLAQMLEKYLAKGEDLHSDKIRQALVEQWLKNPAGRLPYEAEYMMDI